MEVVDSLNFGSSTIVRSLIAAPELNKISKSEGIKKLTLYRRMYLEKDKEVKGRLDTAARKEFEQKYPSISDKGCHEDLYKNKIYSLSDVVLNDDRYKSATH